MIKRYDDGTIEIKGEKSVNILCFKGTIEPAQHEVGDSGTLFLDFGRPSVGRYICPRCGVRNGDNLPVVVGEGVETGGCRECFADSGQVAELVDSLRSVVTGMPVSVPVWW